MSVPNKFAAALRSGAAPKEAPEDPQEASEPKRAPRAPTKKKAATAKPKPATRQGTKQVSAHFDPLVVRQVKQIALDEGATVQELVGEALDLLFQSRKKPTIARRVVDNAAN